jgi:pyrimidine deaminase RibD-like protein
MRFGEFKRASQEHLDEILVRLCAMVVDGQKKDPEHYGMVAAAVLDPDNNCVAAVNYALEDGQHVHAERAAIDAYHQRGGRIPAGSIIVTTCSPCSEDMKERYGESCTDLINDTGIDLVYAGYADSTQHESHAKFKVKVSHNSKIHELCHVFASTFMNQEKQLDELSFLGSPCTKDCSGHRAGYAWSQRKGGRVAQSPWSPSFNKGSQLYVDGK